MSAESNITFDSRWHRNEAKTIQITVYGDDGVTPENVSGVTLQWRLLKHGAALLTKASGGAGITVSGASNNIANIAIAVADYTASIPAGSYRHELWDRTNDRLLTFGTALLQEGSAE